jgi:LPS export ABC transporter permease LptF
MSVLIGTLIATSRLSGDSELIVIRASGISLARIIRPILFFGTCIFLVGLLVSFQLKPWGYKHLSDTLFEIARSKSTAGLEAGMFNDLGPVTLYAEKIDFQTGALKQVIIDDRREDSRRVIVGHTGTMSSNREQRTISLHLANGTIHEKTDAGGYVVTKFDRQELLMDADELVGDTNKRDVNMKELSMVALRQEIANTAENPALTTEKSLRKRLGRLNVELALRYSMPFASIVLALIGYAFGIIPPRTQRTWGIGASIGLSLVVFVMYYGVLTIGMSVFGERGSSMATFGVWLPNILFCLLGGYLLTNLSNERWSSILDAPGAIASSIKRLIPTVRSAP